MKKRKSKGKKKTKLWLKILIIVVLLMTLALMLFFIYLHYGVLYMAVSASVLFLVKAWGKLKSAFSDGIFTWKWS